MNPQGVVLGVVFGVLLGVVFSQHYPLRNPFADRLFGQSGGSVDSELVGERLQLGLGRFGMLF